MSLRATLTRPRPATARSSAPSTPALLPPRSLAPAAPLQAFSERRGAEPGAFPAVPASVGGHPLPAPVREEMERSFGHDFGKVRVHQGPEAKSVGALAYTRGDHVHFQPGRYDPSSRDGRRLLAHELTHVVQQRAGRVAVPRTRGAPVNADPGLEAEADHAGAQAAAGREVSVAGAASPAAGAAGGAVQRWPDGDEELSSREKLTESTRGSEWGSIGRGVHNASGFLHSMVGSYGDGSSVGLPIHKFFSQPHVTEKLKHGATSPMAGEVAGLEKEQWTKAFTASKQKGTSGFLDHSVMGVGSKLPFWMRKGFQTGLSYLPERPTPEQRKEKAKRANEFFSNPINYME